MGLFIAALVFAVSSVTAIHIGHLHRQNVELNHQVEVLETQEDGNSLRMDGIPVRNLSDKNDE